MLLNVVGHHIIYYFLEKKATSQLEKVIDTGNFDESTLIEIKIPLNMPYYSDMGYEVAYGETEINGKKYRFVKRKISGNTLYLLCLPHHDKDKLIAAKRLLDCGGNKSDAEKNNTNLSKLFQVEFVDVSDKTFVENCGTYLKSLYSIINNPNKNQCSLMAIEQPPELS
jgi:hypothetical protein